MDGLHSAFRASEIGRPGQRQEPVADHDPRRRDQPGPDQDGGVLPRHDLRQAGLAASLAHPRRTYGAALADLVNAQFRHPFAEHWGDGTTSSSDGQNFRTGSKAESTGHINPKYGSSPGRTFYTHISDQYAPFHTKVVNVGVRDSTYVLDGLLYHESDLRIEEHYTDTAGFTDHVFALMHLLGFRFAPRIRDLGDTKLYIPKGDAAYDALKPMIGGTLNIKHVRAHWDEILRLATSIKQGTVTASLMLRKLAATHARTAWPWRSASWAASSARCSSWTGCKAWNCAAACMPA